MGQTLTHGVYLPDEGERNCYSGLAANWQLLDGAVGTIAEHTTQIADRAPLVHTHTKSDITDFPAYGTTAGTICEGNDSRLSDARTPVAHTHAKADITDLFNSDNTWSASQIYTGMMILNSSSDVVEQFRQKLPKDVSTSSDALVRFNTLVDSAGHNVVIDSEGHWDTYVAKTINLKYKNDSTKQGSFEFRLRSDGTGLFYPLSPFECDLGNSYNKWKTLNGINPGALSLPSENPSSVNLDPTNWVTDGSNYNSYTPPSDGWLGILVNSADVSDLTGQYIFVGRTSNINFWPQGFSVPLISDYNPSYLSGCVFMPVVSGKIVGIRIKMGKTQTEGSTITARFYPCLGNV